MGSNWLTDAVEKEVAYDKGYSAGKNMVLDEVDEILDNCAHDNGAMIVRALKDLRERYGEKRHR